MGPRRSGPEGFDSRRLRQEEQRERRVFDAVGDPGRHSGDGNCSSVVTEAASRRNRKAGERAVAINSSDDKNHNRRRAWQVNQKIFDGRGRWKTLLTEENKACVDLLLSSDISSWVLKRIGYKSEA